MGQNRSPQMNDRVGHKNNTDTQNSKGNIETVVYQVCESQSAVLRTGNKLCNIM